MKFYFVYKSLAHPELAGNYVQPFTLQERLTHARQASEQLGASIPWLVDAMDNRLKHALGDRPNSEFIIDPDGRIVSKRAWSHPAQVRADLERFLGPSEKVTNEDEIQLKVKLPPPAPAARGVLKRIDRSQLQAIVCEPKVDAEGPAFFAKLRAEADEDLLTTGTGKLYLGFHLDPLHDAHWNNLTRPLSVRLDLPAEAKFETEVLEAPKVAVASDTDPREFLLEIDRWPKSQPVRLKVLYYACVGEKNCYAVQQEYVLHLERDRDGGRARGVGAGFWDGPGFARQMLARDRNGDTKLDRREVQGLVLPHFQYFDTDSDGLLDLQELTAVADWLNHHHQPGRPRSKK